MKERLIPGLILLLALGGCAARPRFTVDTAPEYTSLFSREDGWTGGDAAFSLRLDENRILWLFGDTWVGKVRDGKHQMDSRLINNSIAIQTGKAPEASGLEFHFSSKNGEPAAFVTPADGRGFFWLDHGGIRTGSGLFLFMSRITNPDQRNSLDFEETGLTMAHIPDPDGHPSKWRMLQHEIPWVLKRADGSGRTFGHPLLKAGGMVYIYGMETDAKMLDRRLLVARAPEEGLDDFDAWRFYSEGEWTADFTKASPLAGRMGAELSVSYQPALRKYVAVYTEGGLSRNIMLRFAPAPEGPWSEPSIAYECPEMDWNPDYFCYAAKGHPELSSGDELLVSYVCNAYDFWNMAYDARIYRPKFIRLKFR